MKLLFVHDIKSLVCNGEVYARSYGPDIWARYLEVFESIKVCTRSRNATEEQVKGIDKLTCQGVSFDERIGMFAGPDAFLRKRIKKILAEDIRESDAMICRMDSFMGLMAVEECRRQNKPYIIEVVGCAWDSFWNHGICGKIIAPFMYYIMKRAVKKSKYVIYVTKDFLQQRYPTEGINTNISNVALATPQDKVLKDRITRISNKRNSKTHLFTAANVGVRYKGMHFVIEALGVLKRKGYTGYVYHMVGEGNQSFLRSVAKRCGVEDLVVFHGPVSHSEVIDLLCNQCDVYIQPSLQEGLPRSVIEAMGCALPCICSDVAGIPELVNNAFLFNRSKNIPQQLSRLILSMDSEQQKVQAEINFNKAKEYAYPILREKRNNFLKNFVRDNTI